MFEILITVLNTFLCIIFIVYNLKFIQKKKGLYLFPICNIFIVVSNGLGISFTKYANPDFLMLHNEDVTYTASVVMLIFMVLCTLFQLFLFDKLLRASHTNNCLSVTGGSFFFWILLLFSIVFFIQFFFIHGAFSYLGKIFYLGVSYRQYYANRIFFGSQISNLPGVIFATMLMHFINPVLFSAAFLIRNYKTSKKRRIFYAIAITFVLSSNVLLATVFSKRFNMLFVVLLPLLIYFLFNKKQKIALSLPKPFFASKKNRMRLVGLFALILTISVSALSFISQSTIAESTHLLFERAIIIPAGTNNYYYNIFPKKLDFRGFDKMGKMGKADSNDTSYHDIARLSTGVEFTANSSFLTIAYSAAGFAGVTVITMIYSLICLFHDLLLSRTIPQIKVLCIIVNLYGIYAMSSAPIQTSIVGYGFVSSGLILLLCFKLKRIDLGQQFQIQNVINNTAKLKHIKGKGFNSNS